MCCVGSIGIVCAQGLNLVECCLMDDLQRMETILWMLVFACMAELSRDIERCVLAWRAHGGKGRGLRGWVLGVSQR